MFMIIKKIKKKLVINVFEKRGKKYNNLYIIV